MLRYSPNTNKTTAAAATATATATLSPCLLSPEGGGEYSLHHAAISYTVPCVDAGAIQTSRKGIEEDKRACCRILFSSLVSGLVGDDVEESRAKRLEGEPSPTLVGMWLG